MTTTSSTPKLSLHDRIRAARDELTQAFDAIELVALSGERSRQKEAEQVRPNEMLSRLNLISVINAEMLAKELQEFGANGHDKLGGGDLAGKMRFIAEEMSNLRRELVPLIDARSLRETKLQRELSDLRYELTEAKHIQEDYRKEVDTATRSCEISEATMTTLKAQLKEKSDEVARLRRDANVCLWEREKIKLLENSKKEKSSLQEELEACQNANVRLRKQYQDVKDMLRKANMRSEYVSRQDAFEREDESFAEIERLKRIVYTHEKNASAAVTQLKDLQQQFVGVLNGLQFDYRALKVSLQLDSDSKEMADAVRYQEMLDLLRESCAAGTLDGVRGSLPEHYIGVISDVKQFPLQILKLCDRMKLGENSGSDTGNAATVEETAKLLQHSAVATRLSQVDRAASINEKQMNGRKTSSNDKDTLREHPDLIDRRSGIVKVKESLHYFPFLKSGEIRIYFSKFMKCDKDSNFALDKMELSEALEKILSRKVSDADMEDAMQEMDLNDDGTVDFYEFLCIVEKLTRNAGKTKVLREARKGLMSKICSIQ